MRPVGAVEDAIHQAMHSGPSRCRARFACTYARLAARSAGAAEEAVRAGQPGKDEDDRAGLVGRAGLESPSSPSLHIECPECHEAVPVPIKAWINSEDGGQTLHVEPDLADLWAHAWGHRAGAAGGSER